MPIILSGSPPMFFIQQFPGGLRIHYGLLFVFHSAIGALLLGYILPVLYSTTNGKKVLCLQVILCTFFTLLYWSSYMLYPMPEICAITALFGTILLVVRYYQNPSRLKALGIGLTLGAAISLRQNFQIIGKVFIFALVLLVLIRIFTKKYYFKNNIKNVISGIRSFKGLHYALLGLLIISIPQILINYYRGYLGLFALHDTFRMDTQTQAEFVLTYGFDSILGWPYPVRNKLGLQIMDFIFTGIDKYTLKTDNLIYVIFASPGEFISVVLLRLLLLIDLKITDLYPPVINGKILFLVKTNFLSLLNHIFYSFVFCSLFSKDLRRIVYKRFDIAIWILLFIFNALLQSLPFGEWRYLLPLYMFVYYCNSYKLIGCLVIDGTLSMVKNKTQITVFICLFVLFFNALTENIYIGLN
jgi:hypothetical protein